jgi:hypothetical protein
MNEIPDEHEQERSPHRVRRRRIPHDAQALPQHGDGDALIRHVFIPQIVEREKEDGGIDEAQQRDSVLVTDVLEGEVWQKDAQNHAAIPQQLARRLQLSGVLSGFVAQDRVAHDIAPGQSKHSEEEKPYYPRKVRCELERTHHQPCGRRNGHGDDHVRLPAHLADMDAILKEKMARNFFGNSRS